MTDPEAARSTPAWLWLAIAAFVATIAVVVGASVRTPEPPVYALDDLRPRAVPTGLHGPDTLTIDGRTKALWTKVDLARRTVVGPWEPWDIAVKRHRLVVNGGEGFPGVGGAQRLETPFDMVADAPARGYVASRVTPGGDTVNAAMEDWYEYSLFSHLLQPRPGTYVLRTHDGRFAKLAVLGYYCPGPEPGCLTIEYAYQGDGSRRLAP